MSSYTKSIDQIESCSNIAIIPVGSLEQHGYHLPINTDIVIAQEYANRLGEKLNAFVLPCLPISTCREHMGKRGSTWMNPTTFYQMMEDIIYSLREQGFEKIVVVQGHGGIFIMTPLIRQINATNNPALCVCRIELSEFSAQYLAEGIVEKTNELHANESETSLMLYLHPELVKMDKAVDCAPDAKREYLNYGSIFRYCPDGVWGHATFGTAEKGKRILERGTELGVEYIQNMFSFMVNKPPFGYSKF